MEREKQRQVDRDREMKERDEKRRQEKLLEQNLLMQFNANEPTPLIPAKSKFVCQFCLSISFKVRVFSFHVKRSLRCRSMCTRAHPLSTLFSYSLAYLQPNPSISQTHLNATKQMLRTNFYSINIIDLPPPTTTISIPSYPPRTSSIAVNVAHAGK